GRPVRAFLLAAGRSGRLAAGKGGDLAGPRKRSGGPRRRADRGSRAGLVGGGRRRGDRVRPATGVVDPAGAFLGDRARFRRAEAVVPQLPNGRSVTGTDDFA